MLVIHGMKAYHSKTRSAAQREFAARTKAALAEIEGGGNAPAADTGDKGKKKATTGKGKNQVPRLEKEDIERELVAIHLRHGWLQVQGESHGVHSKSYIEGLVDALVVLRLRYSRHACRDLGVVVQHVG